MSGFYYCFFLLLVNAVAKATEVSDVTYITTQEMLIDMPTRGHFAERLREKILSIKLYNIVDGIYQKNGKAINDGDACSYILDLCDTQSYLTWKDKSSRTVNVQWQRIAIGPPTDTTLGSVILAASINLNYPASVDYKCHCELPIPLPFPPWHKDIWLKPFSACEGDVSLKGTVVIAS